MTRGGKREGAGAKLKALSPRISKTIRFTQAEWNEIIVGATLHGITPSEYVRRKTLGGDN